MSLLTDVDIKKGMGYDIVIEPFSEKSLSPVGYDFGISDYVYSIQEGILEPVDGRYTIPGKNTIQILTKESLWISSRLAGTFHSKVSLVAKGISHSSCTLDPGWFGPLLVTLRNDTDDIISIDEDETIVTLIFHRVKTPTKSKHLKPVFRSDILLSQLSNQTQEYIEKVNSKLNNPKAMELFYKKVEKANRPMMSRIIASVRAKGYHDFYQNVGFLFGYIALLAILTMGFYWKHVSVMFQNLPYDSKIASVQIPAAISIFALIQTFKKK